MAATKAQAHLLARELSRLKPALGPNSGEGKLWQSMVFAIASNVIKSDMTNHFEKACHNGIWPHKDWTPEKDVML